MPIRYKQFVFATHFSHLSFHISIIAFGFLQRQLHSAILQNPASAINGAKFKQLPHLCKKSSRSNRSVSCSQSKQFITPCIVHGCGCGKSKKLSILLGFYLFDTLVLFIVGMIDILCVSHRFPEPVSSKFKPC